MIDFSRLVSSITYTINNSNIPEGTRLSGTVLSANQSFIDTFYEGDIQGLTKENFLAEVISRGMTGRTLYSPITVVESDTAPNFEVGDRETSSRMYYTGSRHNALRFINSLYPFLDEVKSTVFFATDDVTNLNDVRRYARYIPYFNMQFGETIFNPNTLIHDSNASYVWIPYNKEIGLTSVDENGLDGCSLYHGTFPELVSNQSYLDNIVNAVNTYYEEQEVIQAIYVGVVQETDPIETSYETEVPVQITTHTYPDGTYQGMFLDSIINDYYTSIKTECAENSGTLITFDLEEKLERDVQHGFYSRIRITESITSIKAGLLSNDGSFLPFAEIENPQSNTWLRLEGTIDLTEEEELNIDLTTAKVAIVYVKNSSICPTIYINRPTLCRGNTIPDWLPSLSEWELRLVQNLNTTLSLVNQNGIVNESDPIFTNSEAFNFIDGDKEKLDSALQNDDIFDESGFIKEELLPQMGIKFSIGETWAGLPTEPSQGDIFELTTNDLPYPSNVTGGDPTESAGKYQFDGTNWIAKSDTVLYQEVLAMLEDKLDLDMNNLAGDLTEQEQDTIKTKLGIVEGGGELKKIGDGYGLQHQIDNPDNYGTLGNYAINLSVSDAEGDYGATGPGSHAEGFYTTASGYASHAEGGTTTASGAYSHAEGGNTTASGGTSHAEGNYTTAGSYAENARGVYNEIIPPISTTTFNANDVIESVGVGTDNSTRKNALTRWKNGAFKWLLQPLTNITNAVKGFHAADTDGRLNYYDGTAWKKYSLEGEGSGGGYIEILNQFNDVNGDIDLDLITEEGTYVLKTERDQDLNGLPQYSGDGALNVQIDVFKSGGYTYQRAIYFSITQTKPSIAYRYKYGSGSYIPWVDLYDQIDKKNFLQETNNQEDIRFWKGSQAEYDAITTKDTQTLYIIN